MLQHQWLAVHGAEVLLHQEVGEARGAVRVTTGCVQRVQQSLQADVAYEVIVHIFGVGVEVIFLGGVGLATDRTQGYRAGIWVTGGVWLAHGQLGRYSDRELTQENRVSSGESQDLPGAIHRPEREQDSSSSFSWPPEDLPCDGREILPPAGREQSCDSEGQGSLPTLVTDMTLGKGHCLLMPQFTIHPSGDNVYL